MKSITKKAYGKINLILKVGKKREDGKHEVLTVMQKVGVFDTVTVSETDKRGILIECDDGSLATEDNLAYKAAKRYFEAASLTPCVKISIKKRIPVTAGMAGGSSDAGVTLTALEDMYGALGFEKIYEIACELGSDVPFFIYEDKTMLGKGSGTVLTPFPSLQSELYGVFVVSGIEKASTGEMYRLLDEAKEDTENSLEDAEIDLKSATENGDLNTAVSCFCNDFELCNRHIEKLSKILAEHGAEKTVLCGSGPTVCGIFTDEKMAQTASKALPYKCFVCSLIP